MVTRLNRQAQKAVRTIRGHARRNGLGRLTRAQAVSLALGDVADQIKSARINESKAELALITTHLRALRIEGKA